MIDCDLSIALQSHRDSREKKVGIVNPHTQSPPTHAEDLFLQHLPAAYEIEAFAQTLKTIREILPAFGTTRQFLFRSFHPPAISRRDERLLRRHQELLRDSFPIDVQKVLSVADIESIAELVGKRHYRDWLTYQKIGFDYRMSGALSHSVDDAITHVNQNELMTLFDEFDVASSTAMMTSLLAHAPFEAFYFFDLSSARLFCELLKDKPFLLERLLALASNTFAFGRLLQRLCGQEIAGFDDADQLSELLRVMDLEQQYGEEALEHIQSIPFAVYTDVRPVEARMRFDHSGAILADIDVIKAYESDGACRQQFDEFLQNLIPEEFHGLDLPLVDWQSIYQLWCYCIDTGGIEDDQLAKRIDYFHAFVRFFTLSWAQTRDLMTSFFDFDVCLETSVSDFNAVFTISRDFCTNPLNESDKEYLFFKVPKLTPKVVAMLTRLHDLDVLTVDLFIDCVDVGGSYTDDPRFVDILESEWFSAVMTEFKSLGVIKMMSVKECLVATAWPDDVSIENLYDGLRRVFPTQEITVGAMELLAFRPDLSQFLFDPEFAAWFDFLLICHHLNRETAVFPNKLLSFLAIYANPDFRERALSDRFVVDYEQFKRRFAKVDQAYGYDMMYLLLRYPVTEIDWQDYDEFSPVEIVFDGEGMPGVPGLSLDRFLSYGLVRTNPSLSALYEQASDPSVLTSWLSSRDTISRDGAPYIENPDPANLDVAVRFKAMLLMQQLDSNSALREQIAQSILEDIYYTDSEVGGGLLWDHESESLVCKVSHGLPVGDAAFQSIDSESNVSFLPFHNHALDPDMSAYAGPSPWIDLVNGVNGHHTSVVFTAVGVRNENGEDVVQFNVDLYGYPGIVLDLGTYEERVSQR